MRLDLYLVKAKILPSRTLAAKMIAAGYVKVNGQVTTKAASKLAQGDTVSLIRNDLNLYASRAGHKLAGALQAFPQIQVEGKDCLDAGASTGGFTDLLLQAGAARVAAVDVGHDQLIDRLRQDPRVEVYEGMNVRYMQPQDIGGPKDLTVSDLSFISLTKVMEALAAATRPGGDLLLMVKPQFEVGPAKIGKGGVVTDPQARAQALESVQASALQAGLIVAGSAPSPLHGQDGNQEYFLWCQQPSPSQPK